MKYFTSMALGPMKKKDAGLKLAGPTRVLLVRCSLFSFLGLHEGPRYSEVRAGMTVV